MNKILLIALLCINSVTIFSTVPKPGTKKAQAQGQDRIFNMVATTKAIEAEKKYRKEAGRGPRSGNSKRSAYERACTLYANKITRK